MKTLVRTLAALVAVGLGVMLVPVSPASGGGCEDTCANNRKSCDQGCDRNKLTCLATCGLPGLPGYNDCTNKCNSNQTDCGRQCAAEGLLCEGKCRIPH
jgi:hypothetical protein